MEIIVIFRDPSMVILDAIDFVYACNWEHNELTRNRIVTDTSF